MKHINFAIHFCLAALLILTLVSCSGGGASGADMGELLSYDGPASGAQMPVSDTVHEFQFYSVAKDGLIKGSKVMSSSVYAIDALVANDLITETIEGDTRVVFTLRGEKSDNGFEILINGEVFEGDFSLVECKDVERIDIRHK